MRVLGFSRGATSAFVAVAMLVACGRSQLPIGAPATMAHSHVAQSTTEYDASASLLFVTDTTDSEVEVYRAEAKDPNPIAVITDGLMFPFGDCIDGSGTLYVTNQGTGVGFISEYMAGKTKKSKTITKGLYLPVYCAIDAAGNLWVTNAGNNRVTEYRPGATRPSAIIADGVTDPHGIAFDHSGNMYVSNYLGSYEGYIAIYAPGHKSPSRTITDGIAADAGIAVDAKGILYVANSVECNVEEYLAGKDKPYQEITDDIDGPQGLNVGKNGWLYVTNTGTESCKNNGPADVILEFAPASLKPSAKEVSNGIFTPGGSAYSPPLLP
jgi:sugar lactone lactonase YvrE